MFDGLRDIYKNTKHSSCHSVLTECMVSTKKEYKQSSPFVVGSGKVKKLDVLSRVED